MKMTNELQTYCPSCDQKVSAVLKHRDESLKIRGEMITYDAMVVVCPCCGNILGDSRIEGENLNRAYATYRSLHDIISPAEIRQLRIDYGLSTREFSRFLGFGEQTEHRYETGSIPDQAHNVTLLSAGTPEGAKFLLAANGKSLSEKSKEMINRHIETSEQPEEDEQLSMRVHLTSLEDRTPSSTNGYRRIDMNRVAELVLVLAAGCKELYWTKLQKAAYFVDSLCFERTSRSLTGLRYAHADFGPVMNSKDAIRLCLQERGLIELRQCGWGEIVVAKREPSGLFSEDELSLIGEVISFVNTFDSASKLSEYSHGLSAWQQTDSGSVIDYSDYAGEVSEAINRRLVRACRKRCD